MATINFTPKRVAACTAITLFLSLVVLALAGCASDHTASREPTTAQVQPPKPKPPEKRYQAARAAAREGDLNKAIREVKFALQDNPLDAESHFLLGCLLAQKAEHDQATVGFQRAVVLDPANPEAQFNLGTLLLRRGEAVPAARLLENAVLIRPGYVPSYNNLAKAYFQAGLPELAVATYEEALRRDPSNVIALKNHRLLINAAGIHHAAVATEQSPVTAPAPAAPAREPANDDDTEADDLRELLRDLPHVAVERRGGRLTLAGWTSGPIERAMLDKILGKPPEVRDKKELGIVEKPSEILDLTSDDTGDPQRMIEIDAVIFLVRGLDSQHAGFNFLKEINLNFNYFASDNQRSGIGYSAPPNVTGPVNGLSQQGWIFGASADYVVNIANAADERIAVLARPHLTALSGTPAKFLAGGELIFKVTGNIGGDIKPYPFGTTLTVTPTLLRTLDEDGTPRVHLEVDAGRTSVLALLDTDPNQPTAFEKVTVTSKAVLRLGQTLILSGLSQRESRTGRSGVPGLMYVPILKYLFSTRTTLVSDSAVIILLTPRDPAFWDEQNAKALEEFVEKRRAFLQASRGTPEDMRRFKARYPDWQQLAPNRFASHFFLLENSELYRAVSRQDLTSEDLDLELLGPKLK